MLLDIALLLREKTSDDLNVNQIATLFALAVSATPPSQRELGDATENNHATTSRSVMSLGVGQRGRVNPGYGLVSSDTDPANYSRNIVTFTGNGRSVIGEIFEIIERCVILSRQRHG
jgi:DNA-binding MarR family transcriptional regulator